MLFNSFEFLIFFPTVTALYYLLPHRFRWFMLLAASCIFYMAFIPVYILILALTIIIDYFAGIMIERTQGKEKKTYLVISIISTCLVLFVFKYFNFFNSNFAFISQFFHWNYSISALKLILPIGLSFHTFQSLCYVVEVYRGRQKAEYNFGIYSLYVMFYPQLVAGPIERPANLLHQLREKHDFNYSQFTDGLKLMVWGLFKKIVIADRLATFVNPVYDNPGDFMGVSFTIATIFFAFQIYCDFSGYSDIAIGAAQTMGFRLMDNFNRPYFSKSVAEFWKRWHISLSSWFRDYLYIPLGGNKVSVPRWYFNLFFTFLVSGLWHGANWTYVIWGALNGFYLIFSIATQDIRRHFCDRTGLSKFPSIHKYLKIAVTFFLINIAWIFFRAKSTSDAWYILTHLHTGYGYVWNNIHDWDILKQVVALGQRKFEFIVALLAIGFMESVHFLERHGNIRHMLIKKTVWIRFSVYYLLIMSIIIFGFYNKQQFIYFQF